MTDPTQNVPGGTPPTSPPSARPDLVVGLGASAGGLEAFQSFFAALPPDTGLAYVIVQHLERSSPGLLVELLRKVTPMPVVQAGDGTAVGRDHVYVAPPQASARLEGDALRVTPATPEELRGPIDNFFHSLADARQSAAVAIVLSGNGTDGTLGLKAVSDAGGMTMAQDPDTARFDTMPRSAATLGPADRVLAPDKMPEDLLAYARHVRALAAAGEGEALHQQIADALTAVCDVLHKETDHNFKHYKTSTLVRRVGRRMQILRIASAEKYVERLRNDRDEVAVLFRELLIGVTAYFRDPDAFDALAQQVLPHLFENRGPKDPVRIWVPGCATGEEAYTLAILVRERLDQLQHPAEVQIFATDIHERALSVARQGVYPLSVAEDLSAGRLKRFFLKKGNHYHVAKEVRELCLFSSHDLIRDPPFSRLDLISCRNLLIYLGPHLQKKLIPLFHYALRPGGYLFLGPSETITTHRELFRPVDIKHRISQRLPTAVRSALLDPVNGLRVPSRQPEGTAPGEPDLHLVMQRIVLDEFAPRSVVVTEEGQIMCASGGLEKYLGIAAGTFQNNVVKLARTGLRLGLRSALAEAVKTSRTVVNDKITLKSQQGLQRVRVTVQPMPQLGEQSGLLLVVFEDAGPAVNLEARAHGASAEEADALIDQLERELRSTREDLENTIQDLEAANEELKSSNEELLSMNEELQSANEELETSKEEIQAASEAQARSNADLENLLTSTQIATLFLDDELRIQRFTPAMTAVYNLLPTDVGRPLGDITHRAKAMPALPPPRAVHEAGKLFEEEVATTDERWYIRRVLPYRTHHGRPEGMVVTFTDVTALKELESRARDLADLLKLAPVMVRDLDDRIVFWDRGAEQLYGFTAEEAVGRVSHDLLRTTFPRPLEELLAELMRAGEWQGELTHRRKDGTEIAVLCRWVLRPGDGDRQAAILVIASDITDRRRMEAVLRESEGRFRTLADSAPVLIWVNSPTGCEFVNKSYLDYLGMTFEEVRGMNWADYLHPEDAPGYLAAYRQALDTRTQFEAAVRFRRADGEYRWFKAIALPRFGPDGTFRGYVGSSVDITDVREADRQKDTFLAMLAHELRNPLAPVLHAVQVLRLKGPADPLLRQQRDLIDRQIGQMKRLLDDLLDVARISRGRIQVRKEPVDLRAVLDMAAEAARPLMTARAHEFQVSLPDQPLVVEADATRLTQVFTNLLSNASKYTDRGGRVWLTAVPQSEPAGASVAVSVRDTGVGMPPELLSRVFDLFAQSDQSLDRAQGGLGIGLTLVRRLVEMHGGTVEAHSAGPGQGSEFIVRLPLQPDAVLPSLGTRPPEPPAARKLRVLVVDDNVDSADSMALLLGIWEHEVVTAHDGPSGLQLAQSFQPEVVFLDIGLPRMSGYQVARELRKLPGLSNVLLVAVTGYGQDEDKRKSREAGFDHHLMKPVDPDEIQAILASVQGSGS
jgi:two-component system, chemotaxis family, CheB/CheR fusion protein